MYLKVCVLLLAIVLSQARPQIDSAENHSVSQLVKEDCYKRYLPQLMSLNDQFKVDYDQCSDVADRARDDVDKDCTQGDVAAKEACVSITTCSQNTNSIVFFECYRKNAVREKKRDIDVAENSCKSNASSANKEGSDRIYVELVNCMRGSSPVPSGTTNTPAS